ncbi:xanthine dehydrogenase family protein molybdopterin-binding subunit [Pelagibius sp. 7325]|uniref:xanthine dehydrogenase family protein molybdopterin-binding subunit n=1 Tax=Pelagibius sp. 7325 TaxID=3131994 RepID=UPI0030EF62D1
MDVINLITTAEKVPTAPAGLSRRSFLTASAAAGGGLLLGLHLPTRAAAAGTVASDFQPNAFLRIDRAGAVTFIMPYVEMGQGTYTSIPMLIAEELEVRLDQVRLEHAPPDEKLYENPLLGLQVTGGSTSIRAAWTPMRQAGATARTMLIAAAAAAWRVPAAECRAAEGYVTHTSSGRRFAYGALADSAARLPVPEQVPLKDPKDFTLIGTSARRLDTPAKVNGSAVFGIDVQRPHMKVAALATCPVIGGRLADVDDAPALAVKGVRQVVRLDNAVAVIADHTGAARKGLAALKIEWQEGANAGFSTDEMIEEMDKASRQPGVISKEATHGDLDAALASAATRIEAVYQLPLLAHATMEPMNCTVDVRPDGCDVWTGTQVAGRARAVAAEICGLPADKVVLHNHLLGGGFGRRLEVDGVAQAVRIAKQVNGPVKVIWSREEDIQHDIYRPYYYDRVHAGLDADGKPLAWHHKVTGSSILARWAPPVFQNGLDPDAVEAAAGPYGFPASKVEYVRHEPPTGLTTGFWRGVGVTHNAFVVEGFMDELAAAAKRDPVTYRRDLLRDAPRARAVLDLAAEKAGWPGTAGPRSGLGVAVLFGFGTYLAQIAEVAVDDDGGVTVKRVVCAVDCGMTVNPDTVRAQIEGGIVFGLTAALYGNITFRNGRVEQANFDSYQALRIDETPQIDVHRIESSEAPGGIGEPSTACIGPAVVNAVFAATGKRLRTLPIDSASLKTA